MKNIEKNYTESMLLNGYRYTMPGGLMYVSKLQDGEEVEWSYRQDIGDGYAPVCDRKSATMAYVEYIDAEVALDRGCNDHPALARIAKAYAKEMRRMAAEYECEEEATWENWEAIPGWL